MYVNISGKPRSSLPRLTRDAVYKINATAGTPSRQSVAD